MPKGYRYEDDARDWLRERVKGAGDLNRIVSWMIGYMDNDDIEREFVNELTREGYFTEVFTCEECGNDCYAADEDDPDATPVAHLVTEEEAKSEYKGLLAGSYYCEDCLSDHEAADYHTCKQCGLEFNEVLDEIQEVYDREADLLKIEPGYYCEGCLDIIYSDMEDEDEEESE